MKPYQAVAINVIALLALAVPIHLAAQDHSATTENRTQHHHYKLVDMGTFGGLQSYVPEGADIVSPKFLNSKGMLAGSADTSSSDPFPDSCFVEDCLVAHAFLGTKSGKRDLGALPGGASSKTSWITDNDLIFEDSQNGQTDPLIPGLPEIHAVLWQHGHITDLGTLDGGYQSRSMSVNSRAQAVGFGTNGVADPNSIIGLGYQTRAFFWQNGAMQDLGTLGSGTDAIAALINERGQVVGWSYTNSDPSDICAETYNLPLTTGSFVWEDGKGMLDLGGLGGTCTVATSLNDRGQVVGASWLAGDAAQHAFRWDRKHGLIDLSTLGGDFSIAQAINNAGLVVGGSYMSDNVQADAVLWKGSTMLDLGTVDADACSYAFSINELTQVVGVSGDANCASTRASLWERGGSMVDVNALVSSDSGIYVTYALAINVQGEIGGKGVLPNGDERAVLLIPCDEHHPGVAGCDYSLVDATAATRRIAAPVIQRPSIKAMSEVGRMPKHRSGSPLQQGVFHQYRRSSGR
jgi:probable HAF family extracellular repeat protein